MNFVDAIALSFGRYFNFSLRASRSEFWYFIFVMIIGGAIIGEVDKAFFPEYTAGQQTAGFEVSANTDNGPLSKIFFLALLVPWFAVSVRRLHDIGKSGWLVLVGFIPLLGWGMMIYWGCQPGENGPNQFGDDPLRPAGHTQDVFE